MICQKCGSTIGNNERMCLRCGYIPTSNTTTIDNNNQNTNDTNYNSINVNKTLIHEKSAINRFLFFLVSFIALELLAALIVPDEEIIQLLVKNVLGYSNTIKIISGEFNLTILIFYLLQFLIFFAEFYLITRITIFDIFRKGKAVNIVEYSKLKKLLIFLFPIIYMAIIGGVSIMEGIKFTHYLIIILSLNYVALVLSIVLNLKRIKISS